MTNKQYGQSCILLVLYIICTTTRCLEAARRNSCQRTSEPTCRLTQWLWIRIFQDVMLCQWALGVSNVQRALKIPVTTHPATQFHILVDINPQQCQRQPQIPPYMTAIPVD